VQVVARRETGALVAGHRLVGTVAVDVAAHHRSAAILGDQVVAVVEVVGAVLIMVRLAGLSNRAGKPVNMTRAQSKKPKPRRFQSGSFPARINSPTK
jgi:hypothetical protein